MNRVRSLRCFRQISIDQSGAPSSTNQPEIRGQIKIFRSIKIQSWCDISRVYYGEGVSGQKIRHDRREVADVTVYYLRLHTRDKEFMRSRLAPSPPLPSPRTFPRRISVTPCPSPAYILFVRPACSSSSLPCPRMFAGASYQFPAAPRSDRRDNQRSIVRQPNATLLGFVCERH